MSVLQSAPAFATEIDWKLLVSLAALLLSQLPPISQWRRLSLTLECFSTMYIGHKFGKPRAELHVIVSNNGGRKVRIKALTLQFKNASGETFSLPAVTYLQKQGDKDTVLFTPFTLKSDEEWAHIVNFFSPLTRQEDKDVREAVAELRADLEPKVRTRSADTTPVEAEPASVQPFVDRFNRQLKWKHDEYDMALQVITEPAHAIADQKFRMVVFESDSQQMRAAVDGYRFGYGIIYDAQVSDGVLIPIQKAG